MARKGKQLKKAEFQEFPHCYGPLEPMAGKWREEVFKNDLPIVLELGCGNGQFSLQLAEQHPEFNVIGVDIKAVRMWKSARESLDREHNNLAFLCTHLLYLDKHFAPDEAHAIWITFPDPYPKRRQAKHRMINPAFLDLYRRVLKPGSELQFKTDNLDLFHYTLELFVRLGTLDLLELSFDLHEDERVTGDARIITAYEEKFMAQGQKINFLKFRFRD